MRKRRDCDGYPSDQILLLILTWVPTVDVRAGCGGLEESVT